MIKSGELSTRSARYDEFRTDNLIVLNAAAVLALAGLVCLFRARK